MKLTFLGAARTVTGSAHLPAAADSFAAYLTEARGMAAFVPSRGESADLLVARPQLAPAPPLAETAPVTVAAARTPKKKAKPGALASAIALLQEIEASGKKLPKRELNELVRAVDRLWGRLQEK